MDIFLSAIGFLFWPIVIVGLFMFLGKRRRRREDELRQALAEVAKIRGRLTAVEERLAHIEQRSTPPVVGPPEIAVQKERGPKLAAGRAAPAEAPAEPVAAIVSIETSSIVVPPAVAPVEESPVSELRRRLQELERRFIENWTGILGAVVVVAGMTFVGIYTALQLAPFYRFLLTLGVATALVAGSLVLARRLNWRVFAGWLRTTGAAIALFACAAAGGLPGLGLQWVHEPLQALGLLLAGIGANLFLAWTGGLQVTATLHVLLSLVPLVIVPPTITSLAIASAVSFFGVVLGARGRWDQHLAFVLGGYVLFHGVWYVRMGNALDADAERYLAAACALLVLGVAAVAHYRRDYALRAAAPALQVGVHVASWLLLALGVLVYVPSPTVRGTVLLVVAVVAWRFAQHGRVLDVRWLWRADMLAAQVFVLLALVSAFDLGASASLVLLFMLAETLGFRWLVERGDDALLDRVADALPALAAALLAGAGFFDLDLPEPRHIVLAAVLLAGAGLTVLGQWLLRVPREQEAPATSAHEMTRWIRTPGIALGTLAGVLVVVALAAIMGRPWFETGALVAVSALLVFWTRLRPAGLQVGVTVALLGAHAISWGYLLLHDSPGALAVTMHVLPLAALAGFAVWIAHTGWIRPLAVSLAGVTAGLAAWLYFAPVSSLIPGLAWLALSLLALELANRLTGRESLVVLLLGYGYVVAFVVAYTLVIVQTPVYLGMVSVRLLIELFALAVLGYWWLFRPAAAFGSRRAWLLVHPLFVELLLAGAAVTVVVELAALWWAVAWALLALLLLSSTAERLLDVRVRLYSLLFYWVSVVDVAVVMSALEAPSVRWFDRPEFSSLVAVALQVAFAAWAHRRLLLTALELPAALRALSRLGDAVDRRRNLYIFYPLIASIALFLYWRFDRSVLTLLWATEAFVVFVLSAWLRENQFRYVALAGLAACLMRLVLIDMAEANLAVRGLVFIGVGSLMLGMNAIYNRFRTRFAE